MKKKNPATRAGQEIRSSYRFRFPRLKSHLNRTDDVPVLGKAFSLYNNRGRLGLFWFGRLASHAIPAAVTGYRAAWHFQPLSNFTIAHALFTQLLNLALLSFRHFPSHLRSQRIGSAVLPLVPKTIKRSCQISDAYSYAYACFRKNRLTCRPAEENRPGSSTERLLAATRAMWRKTRANGFNLPRR